MCAVLKVYHMAWWLSWLERRPVTAEVVGSNPIRVVSLIIRDNFIKWDLSSAGRASALQAEGHRFEPYRPHFYAQKQLQMLMISTFEVFLLQTNSTYFVLIFTQFALVFCILFFFNVSAQPALS